MHTSLSLAYSPPRTKKRPLVKNEFIVYFRILSRSVQCTYWSQNLLKLNIQSERSIPNKNYEKL